MFLVLVAFLYFFAPASAGAQAAADRSQAAAVASYVVQPGDVLSVMIWGWPDRASKLDGRFPVEANGRAHLPVVGPVQVAGKTTETVQADLRRRLAAEQNQAVIIIEPLFAVGINGEVRDPNVYDFRPGQTLFDAVTRAGGYTVDADRKQLLLVRDGKGVTLRAGSANQLAARLVQTPLQSGDRLLVHPRRRVAASTLLNILQAAVAGATLYTLIKN